MSSDLARAHETLCRGAEMFAGWLNRLEASTHGASIPHVLRSKAIGNAMRELDRFLNLLIDEVSRHHGIPFVAQQRNTANKLRAFRETLGMEHGDHDELLALGRLRDCLFHCQGIARRRDPDDPAMMILVWPGFLGTAVPLQRLAVGTAITIEHRAFEIIARFYQNVAYALVGESFAGHRESHFVQRQADGR